MCVYARAGVRGRKSTASISPENPAKYNDKMEKTRQDVKKFKCLISNDSDIPFSCNFSILGLPVSVTQPLGTASVVYIYNWCNLYC